MTKRAKNFTGLFILSLILAGQGCVSTGTGKPYSPVEGFQAFPSARDFDPPGRVFRKDSDGNIWAVGSLQVKTESGHEETLAISKKQNTSLGGFLKSIGVADDILPAELKTKLSKEIEIELASVSGTREYLEDDSGVYPAVIALFKRVPFKKDNEYYIIRETIASDEITYRSKVNWTANIGSSAEIKKMIDANTDAHWGNENTVTMVKKFKTPLRIWFKAEKIVPKEALGIGPSDLQFDLVEAAGSLTLGILDQADNP